MKLLEQVIEATINNNIDSDGGIYGIPLVVKYISEEIKDIAIDFASYKAEIILRSQFNEYIPSDSELFNQFIEERYKS